MSCVPAAARRVVAKGPFECHCIQVTHGYNTPWHHRCTLMHQQCVELDFQYASEGIHRRWDAGFRITSCAATPDQAAFVLSVPRRRPMDETQETLRTSAFPSTHVKVRLLRVWECCPCCFI